MKFSIKDFSSKCDHILETADWVTFTEEILNAKFHFLPSVCSTDDYQCQSYLEYERC